ncbi:MAG: hypothetical protein ACUVSY_06860 [Roseiflexus sp.]
MKPRSIFYRGIVFVMLVIGVGTVIFAYRASAAAVYIVRGPTTALCSITGQSAPATFQENIFGSELHGFLDQEGVTISFQFPDGRIFSPNDTFFLDGVVDLPPHFALPPYRADVAGDLYFEFPVTNKWPYGCYKLTAVGQGSRQMAVGYLVVTPRTGPPPPSGPARLAVWNNGTFNAFAFHDDLINIHGTNFFPNEVISIWITQPDGAVLDYPQQVASDIGNFQSSFIFTNVHQTGKYTFTALGTLSGYQVFAPFELRARSSTPSGWAQLRVAYPAQLSTRQNGGIAITGALFSPGEYVGLWMTLPNNAVRSLPTQVADGNGDFFVVIDLDERLPTGRYSITAKGVSSGRLQIAGFDVTPGSFQPAPVDNPAGPVPAVVESNTGNAGFGALTTEGSARVAVTFADRSGATDIVRVEGSGYAPNEPIGIWMTFPNGDVLGMASLNVDAGGAFSVDVDLGVILAAGRYRVSVQGVESNRLVIVAFDTAGRGDSAGSGAFVIPPAQTSGGPTNLGGAAGNPGPEQTPRDLQRCAAPEAFWTPDC